MSKYKPCYHKGEKGFMDTDLVLNNIRKWLNETNDEQTLIDTLDICLFFGKIENQEQEIERLKQDNEYLNKVNIELSSRNQKVISMLLRSEIPLNDYLIRDIQNDTYYYLKTIIDILKGSDKE